MIFFSSSRSLGLANASVTGVLVVAFQENKVMLGFTFISHLASSLSLQTFPSFYFNLFTLTAAEADSYGNMYARLMLPCSTFSLYLHFSPPCISEFLSTL